MPGNVCKSLISFKGNEGILEKKKKGKESSVLYLCNSEVSIKKWQLLE